MLRGEGVVAGDSLTVRAGLDQPHLKCGRCHRRAQGQAKNGRIRLSAKVEDKTLHELTIEDSGPGIPQDAREKILEPFFTTKEVGKGTGLGMPIVLRILDLHGLSLSIEDSVDLGGAKMVITRNHRLSAASLLQE